MKKKDRRLSKIHQKYLKDHKRKIRNVILINFWYIVLSWRLSLDNLLKKVLTGQFVITLICNFTWRIKIFQRKTRGFYSYLTGIPNIKVWAPHCKISTAVHWYSQWPLWWTLYHHICRVPIMQANPWFLKSWLSSLRIIPINIQLAIYIELCLQHNYWSFSFLFKNNLSSVL